MQVQKINPTSSPSYSRMLEFLHFLSRQGLSYFCLMTIDNMVFLQYNLIHGIMVIKSHKPKASSPSRLPVTNDLNGTDFSIFPKVISKMMLPRVFPNSTNKQLLHSDKSPRFSVVLSRDSAFWGDTFPLDEMRSGRHGSIHLNHGGKRDKTKPS